MKDSVVIQKRIDEVMSEEFEKLIREYSHDPLLKLILDGKITLALDTIKEYLEKQENAEHSL
jgi:hypothetical protein